jgi:aspartate carbamoyltransferase catalytic subunit
MIDLKGKDVLSTSGFVREDVEGIMEVATKFLPVARKEQTSDLLNGKVLAALFYEPSTRTRLSFEAAMIRLGGRVITVVGVDSSSLSKGETLADTGKMIAGYADVIAMRHAQKGSVAEIAAAADIPVINGGDGPGEHPTQALLDVFTILQERGKIDGLTIALVGDLLNGRTVHSLSYLLSLFKVNLILVSPEKLKMPAFITDILKEKGVNFTETESLEDALKTAQVVYSTRVQKERFTDLAEYEKYKHYYILTRELIEKYNKDLTIMHPLPRVGEITEDVDALPGAAYFRQARNGVAVRMALLAMVLGKA